MTEPSLADWWPSGFGRNSYTVFEVPTGALSVYVRRNVANRNVMEIANVSTIWGFGGARVLYGSFTRDIPAIAENILNPKLDDYLARRGWDWAYRDNGGTPTRVNKAFERKFPEYREARSAFQAILRTISN